MNWHMLKGALSVFLIFCVTMFVMPVLMELFLRWWRYVDALMGAQP